MNKVNSFEDLTCWKKARELKVALYNLATKLPSHEQFGLASQIRRAAVSITANIAEGFGRFTYNEKIHFTHISRASVMECKDHVYSCFDANYITQSEFDSLYSQCDDVGISINGYIGFIRREKNNANY